MKQFLLLLSSLCIISTYAQNPEKIKVPSHVVYKYCEKKKFDEALEMVKTELSDKKSYALCGSMTIIGPVLWNRYSKISALSEVEGGNVSFMVDQQVLKGKLMQNAEDSKKVWDQVYLEVSGSGDFKLRKATYNELEYYWSVISFDIEEPLIIIETSMHRYIVDLSPKDLKILWIDEAP